MGAPLYKQMTNANTGDTAWFAIDDDGSHYQLAEEPSREQQTISEFEHLNPDMEVVGPESFIDSREKRGLTKAESDAQQSARLINAMRDMSEMIDARHNTDWTDLKKHYELHNQYEIAKSKASGALSELSHNNTEHGRDLDTSKMPSYLNPDASALLQGANKVYDDAARAIMGVYGVRIRDKPRQFAPEAQIAPPETDTTTQKDERGAVTPPLPATGAPPNSPGGSGGPPSAPQAPDQDAQDAGHWYDALLTGEGGKKARAGMAGATLGTSRDAAADGAMLASLIGPQDPEGYTRNYRSGSEVNDVATTEAAKNVAARAEYPGYSAAGTALPVVASMGLPVPAAVAGAQLPARLAYGGLVAGGAGAVDEAESVPPDQELPALSRGFVRGAKWGVGGAAAGEALGGAASLAGKLEDPLQRAGYWLRGKAVNAPEDLGAAADAIGQQPGEFPATAVGRRIEQFGLPERYARPMTSGDYAAAADTRAEGSGQALGDILKRNADLNVAAPKSDVLDELIAARRPYAAGTTPDELAKADTLERAVNRLGTRGESLDIEQLQGLKNSWERQGGFRKGEAPPTPRISARKEAAREVAGVLRDALHKTIREQALADDVEPFFRHNQDIAAARAIQSYANGAEGQSGITRPLMRAIHHGVPGMQLLDAGLDVGTDAAASLAKGGAAAAGAARRLGQAVGGSVSAVGRSPASTAFAPRDAALLDLVDGQKQIQEKARGQMLPEVASKLYDQDPRAFGKYAKQFVEARQRGEAQVAALLSRLESDPGFRRDVLPKLQAMTAKRGG